MKPAEFAEGTDAFTRFREAMQKLMGVPHEEIVRREAEYKKQSDANPNRRGPKRKPKPSA
jgi:hypothetical protein